uniref:Uncharacterized protein n=2 Tax=Meloidogyne incognita TaxID=6306 RepID=A0A914KGE3_MELIC
MRLNCDNLTPEDLTSDTSQISTEDEFVCVKRPKMKEIGTMTNKMDIPKVEQNEVRGIYGPVMCDLIILLEICSDFFKGLFNKAKNGVTFVDDWISRHEWFVLSCFTLIAGMVLFYFDCFPPFNKATIIVVFNIISITLIILLFILFLMLICNVFWLAFSPIIYEDVGLGRWWSTLAIVTLIGFVFVLFIYFLVLHKFTMFVFDTLART